VRAATLSFVLVLASGAVGLLACSAGEGNAAFPGGPSDAGGTDGTFTDGPAGGDGSTDGRTDGASFDAGSPTTAIFVQGSPSLPDVRLCWGTSAGVAKVTPFPSDGAMPASNYPGVPLGGVASMSDASGLASAGLTLYALDAENLARQGQASQLPCDQLVCTTGGVSNCLRNNLDYWAVPLTSGASLTEGASNVVALSGCWPAAFDSAATVARCGPSWTALAGNLHADVLRLAAGTASPGQIAVQAAQLSPGIEALAGDASAALLSFGAQDASTTALAILKAEGDLQPLLPESISVGPDLSSFGALGFAVDVPGLEAGAGRLWMSLAESQQLVDPTQDPTQFFGQPRTYLVAVVGDPNAPHAFTPGGGYDGKGLHLLVVASPPPPDAGSEGGGD
jgi:hypothetical protein